MISDTSLKARSARVRVDSKDLQKKIKETVIQCVLKIVSEMDTITDASEVDFEVSVHKVAFLESKQASSNL